MKIIFGHHSPLKAIFLLIIASKHIVVRAGIFNKQSPVTIQHDLFKFIEATKGTPRHQTPSNLQQEFHRFIRKTGGAAELQSSYSSLESLASQPQSFHVPPIKSQSFHVPPTKPKSEFNEKINTYKRKKRSFYQEQITFKPAEPSYVGRNVDQHRYKSFTNLDFGRRERLPKNGQPQYNPRLRGITNFDFRPQRGLPKQNARPQTFFKSEKHFQIESKPHEILNPFLNQPVNPQRNPKFQNIDHRFTTHNKPHTKLHNSDTFPPKKTSTKPAISVQKPSHQFPIINNRPKKIKVNKNSQFTIHRPQTDQNIGFPMPSKRPFDFSSFLNKPVVSAVNVPEKNDGITENRPNRPKKTKGHKNSHFTIHRPQSDQNLAFSRPTNRPVDISSILNKPVTLAVNVPETNDDGIKNTPNRLFTKPSESSDSGCSTSTGMRRPGEVWFSNGCRRSKCIAFRGNSFIETDQCDTEIYNTVYKCIIEVDIEARFPHCCPKYRCNPDNLGHRLKD